MAAPNAPSMVVQAIADQRSPGLERNTTPVTLELTGGTYDSDRTEFSWYIVERHSTPSGQAFQNPTAQNPTLTFPDVSADGTRFTARCDATFYGTGAQSGQTVSNTAQVEFYVNNVPDAVAPAGVTIQFPGLNEDVPAVRERQTFTARADIPPNTGTYDYLEYWWQIVWVNEGNGHVRQDMIVSGEHEQTVTIKALSIEDNHHGSVPIRCVCHVYAYGSNGHRQTTPHRGPALNGTGNEAQFQREAFAHDIPNASIPDIVAIQHLEVNLGLYLPHSFTGHSSRQFALDALATQTEDSDWLSHYANNPYPYTLVELGWRNMWQYMHYNADTSAWEAYAPASTTRGIPAPSPDDPNWADGYGTALLGITSYYQAIFSRGDPGELLPGGVFDGNPEWKWYLVYLIDGIEFFSHRRAIPETVETNRNLIKIVRDNQGVFPGRGRWTIQVEVAVSGADNHAEAGTTATREHHASPGYNEPGPELRTPDIRIPAIPNGLERTTFDPGITIADEGNFASVTYRWSILDHDRNDVTQSDSFVPSRDVEVPTSVKRPTISSATGETLTFYLFVDVHVTGGLPYAAEGTKDGSGERIFYVEDHQPAIAPSVEPELSFVVTGNDGRPGEVWRIFSYIGRQTAGLYDEIAYLWRLWKQGATQNSANDQASTYIWPHDEGTANLTFPPNDTDSDETWVLQMDVTVEGNDVRAQKDSIAVSHGQITFAVHPPPEPLTPFVTINAIPDGKTGETAELSVRVHTAQNEQGRFDYLEGRWLLPDYAIENRNHFTPWVRADDATFTFPVRWPYPVVESSQTFNIEFFLIAHGEGHIAKNFATAAERTVRATARVNPRSAIPAGDLTPAAHLSLYVTDENGSATRIDDVYVTDENGTATQINDIFVTDADGTATRIHAE